MFDLPTFRTDILDSVAYIVASMRHREPEISHEICRLTWDFLARSSRLALSRHF